MAETLVKVGHFHHFSPSSPDSVTDCSVACEPIYLISCGEQARMFTWLIQIS